MTLEAYGRTLPATVDEWLRERAALVVWDMQVGIALRATNFTQLLETIPPIAAAARRRGVPVIYSQHYSVPFEYEDRVWIRTMWERSGRPDPSTLKPMLPIGSPGWQWVPQTAPEDSDAIVPKKRASFFAGTPLTLMLAGLGVDVIVMVGVATDRGVVATAREGLYRGVFTIAVRDAVGSFSESDQTRGLAEMDQLGLVCDSAVVLNAWSARRRRAGVHSQIGGD
jgi:nicotinamidase-related amidase